MSNYLGNWMSKISFTLLMSAMLAALACGGGEAPLQTQPKLDVTSTTAPTKVAATAEDRVLKVAMTFLDEPPDPYQAGWLAVPTGLTETLFRLSESLKPEPWLATAGTQIDPLTWEISLRAGVKFHNGAVMDAAKVKGSLDLALARRAGTRTVLDIERIEVKDPATVVIITNSPNATLLGLLTNQNTAIVDPDTVPSSVDESASGAATTGPYKLVSFTADQAMIVEAHADYWQGPPAMDRIEYAAFTESNTRLISLQSGDVDISINLSPQAAVTVENDSSLELRSAPPSGMIFMFVNHESPAMQDVLVRRAVSLAIDRQAMVDSVAQGNAVAAESMFPPGFLTCANVDGYTYGPEAARQLLADAGYVDSDGDGVVEKDGQPLELIMQTYPQQPLLPPMLEVVQAMLKDIGIGAKVQIVEWTLASQGGYDLFGYVNSTITTGDPQWGLTRQYLTGGDENRGNFSNSKVDELIGQLSEAAGPSKRQSAACDALKAGHDDIALIPVMFPNRLYGISKNVNWPVGPHPLRLYFIDHRIGLK
jgi:peptide/nickel transport system substrate-binding protein